MSYCYRLPPQQNTRGKNATNPETDHQCDPRSHGRSRLKGYFSFMHKRAPTRALYAHLLAGGSLWCSMQPFHWLVYRRNYSASGLVYDKHLCVITLAMATALHTRSLVSTSLPVLVLQFSSRLLLFRHTVSFGSHSVPCALRSPWPRAISDNTPCNPVRDFQIPTLWKCVSVTLYTVRRHRVIGNPSDRKIASSSRHSATTLLFLSREQTFISCQA